MGTLDAAKQLLGICLSPRIDGDVARKGGVVVKEQPVGRVRGDAKHSICEGAHLLLQVGEGGHARGEGGDVVVVEKQPVGGNA
jgi:hypothetical protein